MTHVSYYSYIMYFCLYLSIMIIGFMFGIFVYYNSIDNKDEPLIKHSSNDEIIKVIKTMKKDLIINKDKYSFIEINDIINIIIDIYIKNKFEFKEDDEINRFIENKRKNIIKDVKVKLLINKIIMEKNLLNITLNINDLRSIKENIENHKKEIDNLFELVNEINIIDIRICDD
jgi:hypothetical protein